MRTSCCSADCKNSSNGDSLSYGFANHCALDPSSPLPCFSVFPSSEPLRCSHFSFAASEACSEEKGKKIAPPEEQTKKVCPCCGQGESEGSRLTPTPNENIYIDKSPEELRWQGMTREKLDGLDKSTASSQPQLVLPIFVLTMMPTCNSSASSLSLTQTGTVPAFALSAAINGVTIAPNFGTISGSPCPTFGQSSGAIPLPNAGFGFGFGNGLSQNSGTTSFSSAAPTLCGTLAGCGTSQATPIGTACNNSGKSFGAMPLPNAAGSSAGFGFGNGLSQNSGTASFGSAAPTHCGTLKGCGTSQATPFGTVCNNTGKSFGAIPLHKHGSGPSTGFGWPAHSGTAPLFGAPPAMNHGAPTAPTHRGTTPLFGTACSNSGTSFGVVPFGSSPSFGLPANSGTVSFAPTHHGTVARSQATPLFGSNTGKSFGAISSSSTANSGTLASFGAQPIPGFGQPATLEQQQQYQNLNNQP